MYINLGGREKIGLSSKLTSSSVSEQERENIWLIFLDCLSSSVVGGVNGRSIFGIRPNLGRLMLPFGFLLALTRRPGVLAGALGGTRFFGAVGPWILVICCIRVARFGDWSGLCRLVFNIDRFKLRVELKLSRVLALRIVSLIICTFFVLGRFLGGGLQGRASATGE